jgi:uncharacterized protein YrrD
MAGFDFDIGAQVYCEEEACGKLLKVVVDPQSERVTDLIVARGFLQRIDRVLPVSDVEKTTDQGIYLSIGSDDLEESTEYREIEFREPAPGWNKNGRYRADQVACWPSPWGVVCREPVVPMVRRHIHEGVSPSKEVIERGTPVLNVQGKLGEVDHVLVDHKTGEITYLVVRKGLLPEYPIIPALLVKDIGSEGVFVDISEDGLDGLPRYAPRAEADIVAELQDRLGALSLQDVKVALEDGVLQLTGVVTDVVSKRRTEATARSIDGVLDVQNTLHVDTAIAAHVTAALADDPRTDTAVIEVISRRGLLTLKGKVDSVEISQAAEEIAQERPGVISVTNALEIEPGEFAEHLNPWLVTRPYRKKM